MYEYRKHSALKTNDYVFHQLIPYIGNKRKLLGLIGKAVESTKLEPDTATFFDFFSGSGVVARWAKRLGFRVVANDWEPYAEIINLCAIKQNAPPLFEKQSYADILNILNELPPREDWVTRHLCPTDDEHYDIKKDRMFYTRANGMRLDAMREKIQEWDAAGNIDALQAAALLAPLIYQASYTSNTSGVFKGFHNGWGGQTGTALYRIKSRLTLAPAIFHDNGKHNEVFRCDATRLAKEYSVGGPSLAYIDPPYNQHPYGSNYHVLNSIALWDKPALSPKIESGNKAAIRLDWRTERRSKYNYKGDALEAYGELLQKIKTDWILTSYSTDGTIPLEDLVRTSCDIGATHVVTQGYKRYRVSAQRFSQKPLNIEFVLVAKRGAKGGRPASEITRYIQAQEKAALDTHPETRQD